MGSQQQFCLRWNNHQSNMLSVFDDLFQNEALVDVTLACDGLSIKAHKMVLSACSPYFQNLFLDNPCKHPIVILKDIRFSDLKALMDFMYKGEVNVSQEQLSTLLRTAETLKVRGLTEVAGGSNDLNNSLLSSHHQSGQQQNIVPQTLQQPQQQQQQQQPSQVAAAAAVPTQMQQQQQPRPNGMNQGTLSSSSTTTTTTMVGQSHRSTSSPSPKRKKTRHRHKSDPNSSQSDYEDSGDSRSHELIEPKVEITEENIETDEQLQSDAANNKGLATTGQSRTLVANNLGTSGGGEFATNSHNTQGVSSSQEGSPANDSQGFTVRAANLPMNAKPAALFNQAATSGNVQTLTSVQSIGQPPVLQGSSQVNIVRSCREGECQPDVPAQAGGNPSASCGKKPKGGRPTILYEEEEEDIVTFINHQAFEGMPVDFKQILAYGNGLLRRHGRRPTGNMYCDPSKGLSVKWWRGFKKRHPGLPYLRLK